MQMIKSRFQTLVLQGLSWPALLSLLAFAVLIPFLIIKVGFIVSPIILAALIGGTVFGLILYDFRIGIYAVFLYASFLFLIQRLLPVSLPLGVLSDGLVILSFVSFLIALPKLDKVPMKKYLTHPISIGFLILQIYHLLQLFNPNAVNLNGFLFSVRNFTIPLLFVVFIAFFGSLKQMMSFVYVWLGVALAAAVYGLYQEYFGLLPFEWEEINALPPNEFALIYVWGHLRKFSFLSDPSVFGIFMALSALSCFMMALGPLTRNRRIFWTISGLVMMVSMSYSGTRTAYALLLVGIVFYFLLEIKRKSTMYVMASGVLVVCFIMFGPIHNGTITRLRSTFTPSEDASMEVRDVKRIKWQPYVRHHPIGGGLYTTGTAGVKLSAGHELAGNWDADSGYLQTALETGWIGLILEMLFIFTVMFVGVNNFYALRDPKIVLINLVFLVPFFAITIGQFTQNCMPYKPLFAIGVGTYALFVRLKDFETVTT